MNNVGLWSMVLLVLISSCAMPSNSTTVSTEPGAKEVKPRDLMVGQLSNPREAENYDFASGISSYLPPDGYVYSCDQNDYVGYNNVNFFGGNQKIRFTVAVPSSNSNQVVAITLNDVNGPLLGYLRPGRTAGWTSFDVQQTSLNHYTYGVVGLHTVYFKFLKAENSVNTNTQGICNIESFSVEKNTAAPYDAIANINDYYTELDGPEMVFNTGTSSYELQYVNQVEGKEALIGFDQVDFGTNGNAKTLFVELATPRSNMTMRMRVDGVLQSQVLDIQSTGSYTSYQPRQVGVGTLNGIHKLELLFGDKTSNTVNGVANFRRFKVTDGTTF